MLQNAEEQYTESRLQSCARQTLTFHVAQRYGRQGERTELFNAILDSLAEIEGEGEGLSSSARASGEAQNGRNSANLAAAAQPNRQPRLYHAVELVFKLVSLEIGNANLFS